MKSGNLFSCSEINRKSRSDTTWFVAVFLTLFLVIVSAGAYAARRKQPTPAVTEKEVFETSRQSIADLNVLCGAGYIAGVFIGDAIVGAGFKVDRATGSTVGLDTGILINDDILLPIMLTGICPFAGSSPSTRPYMGMSFGLVAGLTSGGVNLIMLLRPGLSITVSKEVDLKAEVPLGQIAKGFFITPLVGLTVHI